MKILTLAALALLWTAQVHAEDKAAEDTKQVAEEGAVDPMSDNAVAKKNAKAVVEAPAKKKAAEKKAKKAAAKVQAAGKAVTKKDGLVVEDVKLGSGKEAKLGSEITVHYKGTLVKGGKQFDASYGGDPISFELAEGRLIKGWTEGIPGMKEGGKRKLTIPYALAYGEAGTPDGSIPPKSDLNFEVELIKVQ